MTPMVTGHYYLSIDTWYHRMYRLGCISGLSIIKIEIRNKETQEFMSEFKYHDQWGTRSRELKLIGRRNYEAIVTVDWHFPTQMKSRVYREFTLML